LLAATSTAALAQRNDGGNRGPGRDNAQQQQPNRSAQDRGMRGPTTNATPSFNGRNGNGAGQFNNNNQRFDNNRPGNNDNRFDNNRNDNRFGNNNNNRFDNRPGFNPRGGTNWRNDSWNDYRRVFNSPQRFRAPAWRAPTSNWRYTRFSFGAILPSLFFSSNYYINDWSNYGFDYPPPGTRWVRYGPDALLIDVYTREIIQVRYNAFY
jgi:Ni/Co efflux regulator RcnB